MWPPKSEEVNVCLMMYSRGKTIFRVSVFQENGFLFNISVNRQSRYTITNLNSKLAPNWLTNVKVIDFVFSGTGPLALDHLI